METIIMKRQIEDKLLAWKEKESKKPLLIVGARQIGKTFTIRHFCENNYQHVVYINLEKEREIADIFKNTLDPNKIIQQIELYLNIEIKEHNSILILDEIQVCEEAITSLKYFYEDKQSLSIIGAGSLLGVKLHRFQSSFPVGKVEMLTMVPMNFHEYLIALEEDKLITFIQESFTKMSAIPESIHNKALSLYKEYLYIGGMPEMVLQRKVHTSIFDVDTSIQEMINTAYLADMHKYTSNTESIKNIQIYQSIPAQLAKENKKFKYSLVDKSARSKYYQTSLDWLLTSKLLLKSTSLTTPKIPLKAYEDSTVFKIYCSDTGLLSKNTRLSLKDLIHEQHENTMYLGAIAENYIANEFTSYGLPLNYYTFANYEIDFILQTKDGVIPIEVKAGKRTTSTSLLKYMQKFTDTYAIRFSTKNFGYEKQIKSIPLYAVFAYCESL